VSSNGVYRFGWFESSIRGIVDTPVFALCLKLPLDLVKQLLADNGLMNSLNELSAISQLPNVKGIG
jgi:hypothetical protein